MTKRGRELLDVMRRNVDIACVHETRWKGNCARELGSGYKLIYAGCSNPGTMVYNGKIWNIISAYAPQVGLSPQEKEEFLESLETVLEATIPIEDKVIIGGDFNAHLG